MEEDADSKRKQLINVSTDLSDIRSDQPARKLRWAGCTVTLFDIKSQLEVAFPPGEGVENDPDPILKSNRGGLGVVRKGRVVDGSEYITVVVKFRRFNINRFLYDRKNKVQSP